MMNPPETATAAWPPLGEAAVCDVEASLYSDVHEFAPTMNGISIRSHEHEK
jgi:hypothetical protein